MMRSLPALTREYPYVARSAIRDSTDEPGKALHHSSDPAAGSRHRGEYGYFQLCKRTPVAASAGSRSRELVPSPEDTREAGQADTSFFYRQFQAVSQNKKLFSAAIAEQEWFSGNLQPFSASDSVRLVTTQIVSPNYFSELGVRALRGRVLNAADTAASSDIAVVLSYQFWESQFNRDPAIIGRKIRVKNYPFLVVGILPRISWHRSRASPGWAPADLCGSNVDRNRSRVANHWVF
jgi:hypothetical protein